MQQSPYKDSLRAIQSRYDSINALKEKAIAEFSSGTGLSNTETEEIKALDEQSNAYRNDFKALSTKATGKDSNDTNYVFLSFVKHYLPAGLKGLLIAIIFLAAWGSIAASLNALAASTVCDFHQRILGKDKPINEYKASKWYTFGWGIFSIIIAQTSSALGQSLIEAVNVLGSLFYGVILGIFLVAFYLKRVNGTAVFIAALVGEAFVVILFFNEQIDSMKWLPNISFLWLNAIGAIVVVALSALFQTLQFNRS
jgi:Na+/proline symporter